MDLHHFNFFIKQVDANRLGEMLFENLVFLLINLLGDRQVHLSVSEILGKPKTVTEI